MGDPTAQAPRPRRRCHLQYDSEPPSIEIEADFAFPYLRLLLTPHCVHRRLLSSTSQFALTVVFVDETFGIISGKKQVPVVEEVPAVTEITEEAPVADTVEV